MTGALTTLQQWLLLSGVVGLVGCVTWRMLIAPRAARDLGDRGSTAMAGVERRVGRLARMAAAVLLVAWALRMVVQVMAFRDPFVPLRDDLSLLLFETSWGTVWMGQGGVAVLLAGAIGIATRAVPGADLTGGGARRAGWSAAALLVVALVATLALSSHAAGVDSGRTIALAADGLHALAAGGWIGSLGVIVLAGPTPGADSADPSAFAAQLRCFSPVALVAGGTLVSMGIVLSWVHVPTVSDLWTSTYGRLLSAKVGLAVFVLGLGFWNWRRGLARSDTPEGASAVRRRAALEVGLAVGVIFLTAVLVHSVKP